MLTDAEIAARYVKIRPYLDERQRRLWLGVEAQALGSGGVAVIARATGADVKTVRRGTARHLQRHQFHGNWNYTIPADPPGDTTRPNEGN